MIDTGSRYEILPSFLLGFHGTDQLTAEEVLAGTKHLSASQNEYDWLGHGIYFWEYSPLRAYQFAQEKFRWLGRNESVAVVGAVINPGLCLNLLDASGLKHLETGYQAMLTGRGGPEFLPKNGVGKERWNRRLDCAVINTLHQVRALTHSTKWQKANAGQQALQPFDSVRGAFWEGEPVRVLRSLTSATSPRHYRCRSRRRKLPAYSSWSAAIASITRWLHRE